VRRKFGVRPVSIPDYLALVGDASDGFPGLRGWGAKSAGSALARYVHLEAIPKDASLWDIPIRGAAGLAASLRDHWEDALLFRDLATLRTDAPVFEDVNELEWRGPAGDFAPLCERLGAPELAQRAARLTL
jgi:5'-3' exonuclease